MHASQPILGDLQKLNPKIRAEVRRVAGADLDAADPRGAERPMPARAMPVSASRVVSLPAPAMPMGSAKPAADWPQTSSTLASGLARPTAHPSLPSKTGPRR
jgi:hypothetical protein